MRLLSFLIIGFGIFIPSEASADWYLPLPFLPLLRCKLERIHHYPEQRRTERWVAPYRARANRALSHDPFPAHRFADLQVAFIPRVAFDTRTNTRHIALRWSPYTAWLNTGDPTATELSQAAGVLITGRHQEFKTSTQFIKNGVSIELIATCRID